MTAIAGSPARFATQHFDVEFSHDPAQDFGDPRVSVSEAHMIKVTTCHGTVEITLSNGAMHVALSESMLGETKAEFLMSIGEFFQKV